MSALKDDWLFKKISELESLNDQLLAELHYLDDLLKQVGFSHGLKTLKRAIEELIAQDSEEHGNSQSKSDK